MPETDPAQAITDVVAAALPDPEKRATPAEIEALLRRFAPVTKALRKRVRDLVEERCGTWRMYDVDHWLEAQSAVNPDDPEVERTIAFLVMDTCTCVLDHLPAAIAHAKGPVDPRILALLPRKSE